jgi:hypothetical protein
LVDKLSMLEHFIYDMDKYLQKFRTNGFDQELFINEVIPKIINIISGGNLKNEGEGDDVGESTFVKKIIESILALIKFDFDKVN